MEELQEVLAPVRLKLEKLEAENASLRSAIGKASPGTSD
jgi:hypothetical protein